ncbi:D-(-)-3-hydroxybutyrate oligomer hydrolase [Aquincola sp. J276]|uniref:D-(-)-3-hydroxybutyrate oligomer hydrolase n=1 Tax=Aquincola sp. J276 TaxID=2898432 RepID=UPI002151CA36|nr:D-(-)-3-hydroxybutyrate oligomer hydrolase [Aquincola sp. J276]MCR5868539.1 D-(-)-3-hydroxybutyrate oligomer hydrolase [Aquincola sp. J276]
MRKTLLAGLVPVVLLPACGGSDDAPSNAYAQRPAFLAAEPRRIDFDGRTAGLVTGNAADLPALLAYAAPAGEPTAATLRTLQIHASYAGLDDLSAGGGFGVYFGVLDPRANQGSEYIAVSDDGSGRQNVTMAVQVPSHFDPARPCIVTATSSGSRGIYAEVPTVGEWALGKGCAVAYTDKGTGVGVHDLNRDRAYATDGSLVAAGQRQDLVFNANLLGDDLAAYRAAFPNRFAVKQLHSRQNPEKDWGAYTLQSIKVALYVLNQRFPQAGFTPKNTVVIASSISNGGGAALRAAEQDTEGLIGGVAVSEPQVNLPDDAGLTVRRGDVVVPVAGRPLFDYFTFANLYQPCATQAPAIRDGTAFVAAPLAAARCAALAQHGLVAGATLDAQATDALARLRAYGWEPESDRLHDSHYGFEFTNLVAMSYASAYARAAVTEPLCGYSVGGVGATTPGTPAEAALKSFWGTGSGLPAGPITIVNDQAVGGPAKDTVSVSASTGRADYNVDGALCLRRLMTGAAVGRTPISAAEQAVAARVRTGLAEVRVTGNLRGKPAIIVQGRADTLLPVNHAARPYAALNRRADAASDLRYYEVTDANHFDALVTFYPRVMVPLLVYGRRSLELMHSRLTTGAALPPSQVVRATARASAAATLSDAQLPPIAATPAAADTISVGPGTIAVPD